MFRWASRCPQINKTWALTESISDISAYILSRRHKLRPAIRQTYTFSVRVWSRSWSALPVSLSKVSNLVFILDNVLETASNLNLAGLVL